MKQFFLNRKFHMNLVTIKQMYFALVYIPGKH